MLVCPIRAWPFGAVLGEVETIWRTSRTTIGLIPIKGYVGSHGYNDAAQMMIKIGMPQGVLIIRPKFEVFQIVYEVENCEHNSWLRIGSQL